MLSTLIRVFYITCCVLATTLTTTDVQNNDLSPAGDLGVFQRFFRSVVKKYDRGNDVLVERLPDQIKLCIFGNYSDATQKATEDLMSALADNTTLDIWRIYKPQVQDCDKDTLLFIRFHSGGQWIIDSLIADVGWIAPRHGTKIPYSRFRFNEYGMAINAREPGLFPYGYAAIYQFDRSNEQSQKALFLRTFEQELLRLLVRTDDGFRDEHTVSVLNAPRLPDDRGSAHPPNLCLDDMMLLTILYGSNSATVPTFYSLLSYEDQIRQNFDELKSKANEILSDPKYRAIFPGKC